MEALWKFFEQSEEVFCSSFGNYVESRRERGFRVTLEVFLEFQVILMVVGDEVVNKSVKMSIWGFECN